MCHIFTPYIHIYRLYIFTYKHILQNHIIPYSLIKDTLRNAKRLFDGPSRGWDKLGEICYDSVKRESWEMHSAL